MTEVEVLRSRIEDLARAINVQRETIGTMLETEQRVLHCLSLLRDAVYGDDSGQ